MAAWESQHRAALIEYRLELAGYGTRALELEGKGPPIILLSVAGQTDVLAPRAAVHHVGEVLPNAAQVRLETAPGAHLGVLTGRGAVRSTRPLPDGFLAEPAPPRRLRAAA